MPVSATATSGQAVPVFVSYAHEDVDYLEKLKESLAGLQHANLIETWTDHLLMPGEPWDPRIRDALEQARLVLLLVSPPFIASRYIHQVELKNALERARRFEVNVVPILIRKADWEDELGFLEPLPANRLPVSKWDPDDYWYAISTGLKKVIQSMGGTPQNRAPARRSPAAVKTIPENIVKLCDRSGQELAFSLFNEEMSAKRPGAAQVYVLVEDDVDRPEFLVDRLYELRVPSLAVTSRGERRASCLRQSGGSLPVYGNLRASQGWLEKNFFEIFGAPAPNLPRACSLLGDEGLSKHSHIVVDQTLDGERVAPYADKLVEWFTDEFWANAASASTQWLVFLTLRFSSLDRGNADLRARLTEKLGRLFRKRGERNTAPGGSGAPALLLPAPEPLRVDDVKDVLEQYPIGGIREINRLAVAIFEELQREGTARLDDLHSKLELLRRSYLETGKWEWPIAGQVNAQEQPNERMG